MSGRSLTHDSPRPCLSDAAPSSASYVTTGCTHIQNEIAPTGVAHRTARSHRLGQVRLGGKEKSLTDNVCEGQSHEKPLLLARLKTTATNHMP